MVADVGITITDDDERLPTAVVDASNAPGLADLARVHATDGVGDVQTVAQRLELDGVGVVLLGITMTTPVRATFALAFDHTAHGPFLGDVADAGRLVIATTEPTHAAADRPLWLAVDIEGDALRAALDVPAGDDGMV